LSIIVCDVVFKRFTTTLCMLTLDQCYRCQIQSQSGSYTIAPWNGYYNDEALPVGSYYFIIEYNDEFTENSIGTVSIIK
jgi:hypothetical protein